MNSNQYAFSKRSRAALDSCHPDLIRLFEEVIKHVDCTIIEGHRNEVTQNQYFMAGKSQVVFPKSKHNSFPSNAVDVVVYHTGSNSIRWDHINDHYQFVGFVRGIASQMGIKIRCGADWNRDYDTYDQDFHDLPHFELV